MDFPKSKVVSKVKRFNFRVTKEWAKLLFISIVLCCAGLLNLAYPQEPQTRRLLRNEIIEHGPFLQIPGPNPILRPGHGSDWDAAAIEAGNVLKDGNTYYLYYHGTPTDWETWPRALFRIGVATAPHPLGPWTKYEGNPILDIGPKDSWDDSWVACAAVLKEKGDKFYMWYSANFKVGLAYASSPLGAWKKYEGNPVTEYTFGYVGGVIKVKDKYHMYNTYPLGEVDPLASTAPDEGPICLATADKPEGPWLRYKGNPLISVGDWGAWDEGGFSEAGVLYHDGVFHCFYGGTKWEDFKRIGYVNNPQKSDPLYIEHQKLESIGYAYSFDGYNFIKYSSNPVAPRENNPDASAFAEVHAFWEPPFHYVFHTLRYNSRGGEDIGVQVLVNQKPFSLRMPVLNQESLGAGKITSLTNSSSVSLANISRLTLTAECGYSQNASRPMLVHVRSSYDGLNYDTTDLYNLVNDIEPGKTVRKTVELEPKVQFIKVLVENLDQSQSVSDVKIIATLGS